MNKSVLLYLFCCFSWATHAQPMISTDTITIVEIGQEQGLSQLGAATMVFDHKGYLWIGTQNGLNRFNGYQMKVYHASNKEGDLADDHIRSIHYTPDTLWLATNTHGLLTYIKSEDRFLDFKNKLDLTKHPNLKYAYVLYAPNMNDLIMGTVGHCLWIDKSTLDFKVIPLIGIKDNDFVTAIHKTGTGGFLVGTNSSGLHVLNSHYDEISSDKSFVELKDAQINCFYQLDSSVIWIGTNKGLYQYDIDRDKCKRLSDNAVRSIQRWDEHTILIGGVNSNYLVSQDMVWKKAVFINPLGKVLQADILSFARDEQGGRWVGTETRGVFYYHPNRQKFVPQRIKAENAPKQDFVSTFNFLREGDVLWMASEFGFIKHELQTDRFKLYRTDLLEYTLAKDAKGNIWGGGFGQGLVKYNRQRDRFDQVSLSFDDQDIIQITPVHKDTIWAHTWSSGIYAVNIRDYGSRAVSIFGKQLVRSRISLIDSRGGIWIGSDEGLYQITSDQTIYYDSLSNERVFALAEDHQGHIWVGTAKGLNYIRPTTKEIVPFVQQPGLPNDFIYAIEVDGKDNVWVSTNHGLSVLDRETRTFRNYTEEDGLQNNEFNGKAGYQDSLGYLYFGGMNGFNIFHPDSLFTNLKIGRTWIEDVKLFGKSLPKEILYTDTLVFLHDQNVISFDFASLNYLWPHKNRYQFMLQGFDQEWRPVTRDLSATYTNLDPGTYTFRVRGSNHELLWGDYDEIVVIIKSPWYQTFWFKLCFTVFALLLIIAFFMNKSRRQKKINQRLAIMVHERTEELHNINHALNESLKVTQQQKQNISFLMEELNHRVKNNLQLITSLIDIQSLQVQDRQVGRRLKDLQSRVFTVAKIHDVLNQTDVPNTVDANAFINKLAQDIIIFSGIEIVLSVEVSNITLSTQKLTYIGLILNELITNSIKHAFNAHDHKSISIGMFEEESTDLILVYRDNGKGFDMGKDNNLEHKGINLINILVGELKGTVKKYNDNGAVYNIVLQKNQLDPTRDPK